MSLLIRRSIALSVVLSFCVPIAFSNVSQSSIHSALLISLGQIKGSTTPKSGQRRSWSENTVEQKRVLLGNEALLEPQDNRQSSPFSASHGNSIPTNTDLVSLLEEVFQDDVTEQDLESAINYLIENQFRSFSRIHSVCLEISSYCLHQSDSEISKYRIIRIV